MSVDIEDLLTEAQDAFFENNFPEAERICSQIISTKPNEGDAYSLLCVVYTQLAKFSEAASVAKNWGKNAGYAAGQLRIQAENAFMVDDTESLLESADKLMNHRWREPVGLFVKALASALCADLGEASLAGQLLNSCEGENMEEDEEVLIELFVAWAETKIGNDRHKVGVEGLKKILTSDNIHYRGLATALLALDHLNEGNLDAAEAVIPEEFKVTNDDANIAGVRALLHVARNEQQSPEWKRWVDRAATGSNVLIKKHIWKLLNTQSKSDGPAR